MCKLTLGYGIIEIEHTSPVLVLGNILKLSVPTNMVLVLGERLIFGWYVRRVAII
jgi:hypothetical protein